MSKDLFADIFSLVLFFLFGMSHLGRLMADARHDIFKGVYHALVLDELESSQLSDTVLNIATVDTQAISFMKLWAFRMPHVTVRLRIAF